MAPLEPVPSSTPPVPQVVSDRSKASWTGPRPFVGRTDVLSTLHKELDRALAGRGRLVLLEGQDGCGRSSVARKFVAEAKVRRRGLRIAIADAADPKHPAWRQVAFQFTASRRAFGAIARNLPSWIGLIPLLGGLLEALLESAMVLWRRFRPREDRIEALGTGSTVDEVRRLLGHGAADPRLIVLENLEASDPGELAGAFALVQRLGQTHTLLVATSTSERGRLPPPVADLLREAERLKWGRAVAIEPLNSAERLHVVTEATGERPPESWRSWLTERLPGTPAELWTCLGGLVESGHLRPNGRRWSWSDSPPAGEARLAPPREAVGLAEEDRRLLAVAACLGVSFDSDRLAAVLDLPELTVEDRLAALARQGIVVYEDTLPGLNELTDVYRFPDAGIAARWRSMIEREERARYSQAAASSSSNETIPDESERAAPA